MSAFPASFLWGASTSPHQTEGNNVNSDWWAQEHLIPGMQPSGDAVDSYHRYREDMRLLADAGLNAYRFGIEWARIEPRPGQFSNAELAHYRRMIETAVELGLTPVVTLHHFSHPRWFAEEGGWHTTGGIDRFVSYVTRASEILGGVEYVVTINEPNILAMMIAIQQAVRSGESPTVGVGGERGRSAMDLPVPTPEFGQPLIDAHHAVRDIVRNRTGAKVGWSIANGALTATPGNEQKLAEVRELSEDLYLKATRGDDFVGVQAYSSQQVDENGLVPHPEHPDNTLTGVPYRPDALGMAVRHTAAITRLPILVTENGIATADDNRRIAYTSEALCHLASAMADGIDVRGYLHWSLLDSSSGDTGCRPSDSLPSTAKPSHEPRSQVSLGSARSPTACRC